MDQTRQNAPEDAIKPDGTAGKAPDSGKDEAAQPSGGEQQAKPEGVNLMAELIESQNKANEYLEGMKRERAEFVNYRKRMEKEQAETFQNATVDTLKKILPVIDDFDRAITNVPADKADDEVIKGFSLIHRKLLTLLDNAGVKVINPVGEVFNPAFHEALGQDESSDVPSGHITAVLQKGYLNGDKVIRPALVRIAR